MRIFYHAGMALFDLPGATAGLDDVEITSFATAAELAAVAGAADALFLTVAGYTEAVAAAACAPGSRVRWIQFLSAGFETAERHGVPRGCVVTNASSAWGPIVAEHGVSLLLALNRQVHELERHRAAKRWDRAAITPQLRSLEGARIGLLGYGMIGREMALRLRGFGPSLHGIARTPGVPAELDSMHPPSDLASLAPSLDVLLSAIPLSAQTRHIVDEVVLARLPTHAVVVNVGRGQTIDEAALARHLAEGSLAGAALDVFETEPLPKTSPLWELPNVILSPHMAVMGSKAAWQRLARMCRENIERFQRHDELPHQVSVLLS